MTALEAPKLNWGAVHDAEERDRRPSTPRGLSFLMKKHKITILSGFGRVTGPAQGRRAYGGVDGGGRDWSQVKAKNVIVATGSAAKMMPGLKPDDSDFDEY